MRTIAIYSGIALLAVSAFWSHASAQDSGEGQALLDRVRSLEERNSLLMKENELLKREIELLKRERGQPEAEPFEPTSVPEPAQDPLPVGSRWEGAQRVVRSSHSQKPYESRCELAITGRNGTGFEGIVSFANNWQGEVKGELSPRGELRWGYTRVLRWHDGATEADKSWNIGTYEARGVIKSNVINCRFEWYSPPAGERYGTIGLKRTD